PVLKYLPSIVFTVPVFTLKTTAIGVNAALIRFCMSCSVIKHRAHRRYNLRKSALHVLRLFLHHILDILIRSFFSRTFCYALSRVAIILMSCLSFSFLVYTFIVFLTECGLKDGLNNSLSLDIYIIKYLSKRVIGFVCNLYLFDTYI